MKGMPFHFPGKGVFTVPTPDFSSPKWKKSSSEPTSVLDNRRSPSPTSTSTLSSSLGGGGSSTDTAGGAAADHHLPQKWPPESGPGKEEWVGGEMGGAGKGGAGMEDWDQVLMESSVNDTSFLRWIMGDMEDPMKLQNNPAAVGADFGEATVEAAGFSVDPAGLLLDSASGGVVNMNALTGGFSSLPKLAANFAGTNAGFNGNQGFPPPGILYQQVEPEKTQSLFVANTLASNHVGFYLPEMHVPPAKRHQPIELNQNWIPSPPPQAAMGIPPIVKQEYQIMPPSKVPPFSDSSGQEFLLRRQHQQQQHAVSLLQQQQQQQQRARARCGGGGNNGIFAAEDATLMAVVEQLHKAAELAESGNSVHARAILARLNQYLSPAGKALHRASFYFKEALLYLLSKGGGGGYSMALPPPVNSIRDVVLRIGAYKEFTEISPLVQFSNFTCNQAVLDSLDSPKPIHILDFDIGIGGQWSSLMQEIKAKFGISPTLKITAFTSPYSHDQLELALTRDNLMTFANLNNIQFELNFVDLDSFDPAPPSVCNATEVTIVNFPISAHRFFASSSLPSLIQFVKELRPKVVLSVDHSCDRTDLSFSQFFMHGLQFYSLLFESLDATNADADILNKIEGLLMLPRIQSILASRYRTVSEKLPPWRSLFVSAGFSPVPFSSFTETIAECLVKRLRARGFNVEKHHASLLLSWQRRELVSVSAWRC